MKKKTVVIDGETHIKCGKVEVKDKNKPFTTSVIIDGKNLSDAYNIQSLKYEVKVNGPNAGKSKLTFEYYPRSE